MEQLIPHSLLRRYQITTQTPLEPTENAYAHPHEPVLEVEESDKAIRQVLMNYSIQPSGRMKENRRLLKLLSEEIHRKLVYITPR